MKNKVIFSVLYVVLGILTVLAPTVIFPVCAGDMGMRCTYTGHAEVGLGLLLAILGLVSLFLQEKVRAGISIATVGIGGFVIALPVGLIGVCGSNMMKCNVATRPLLVVLGVLIILVSLINAVFLLRSKEVEN